MKWMRGYGTRLVWNSVMSTLSASSKRATAVSDEMTCPTRRLRLVCVEGRCRGAAADVVDRLVVEHDRDVGVLEERVSGQHGVVGLNHRGGHLGGGVDGEPELGLLAVIHGETPRGGGAEGRNVPPPTALNTMKPWRPVQLSASLRMRSRHRSTISLPMV